MHRYPFPLVTSMFALAISSSACNSGLGPDDNPDTLRDSSGLTFVWTCGDQGCQLDAPTANTLPKLACNAANTPGIGAKWARLFEICQVCTNDLGWSTTPAHCRPAACQQDVDCPQLYGTGTEYRFACRQGLCQATEDRRAALLDNDVVTALCLAPIDRLSTMSPLAPAALEATDAAQDACPRDGSRCEVPPRCWQP